MRYIKGYVLNNVSRWVGKEWYHQRFDGSPFFMHLISEGEIETDLNKKLSNNFTVHYCFYEDGKADWYILLDDIKRITENIILKSKKNPKISRDLICKWKKEKEMFYTYCKNITKVNLERLDDKSLISELMKFGKLSIKKNSSSSIIDGFALGSDELLAHEIKTYYDKSNIEVGFEKAFSIITSPLHTSFVQEAEQSLVRIADYVQKNKLDVKDKSVLKKIKAHTRNFFWIKNNYVHDYVLDEEYFFGELKELLRTRNDFSKELEMIKNRAHKIKVWKENMIDKLHLPFDLRTLVKITEDFTYWQDERKKSTLWNMHYFSLFLEEIGKRIGVDKELLKYMMLEEFEDIFEKNLNINELKERKKFSVTYWDEKGMETVILKDVEKVLKKIVPKNNLGAVDDFRGLTASVGKAVGRVRIVKSAKEISKVKVGDVLVAVMTRPDYVSAMKKASAIVTDEGGITCHAAIVSRELGLPCIIGTKIATHVLRDGQLVEVNANHGWVKIIKS